MKQKLRGRPRLQLQSTWLPCSEVRRPLQQTRRRRTALISSCAGSMFIKLTAGGEPLERMYFLTEDKRYLKWNSNVWAFKSALNKQIDVHSIKRIQRGLLSAKFERWKPILQCAATRSFSIVYGDDARTLDLIADSEELLDVWYRGLRQVKREASSALDGMSAAELYLQASFETASCKSSSPMKSIDLGDLQTTLQRMSYPINDKALDTVVLSVCGSLDSEITRQDFDRIVHSLRRRFDLEHLWKMLVAKSFDEEWSSGCPKFGIAILAKKDGFNSSALLPSAETIFESDFREFWCLFQGSNYSEKEIDMMILDAKPLNFSEDSGESKRLTYEHFHRIMCAPSNDAYDPKAKMKRLDKFREPLSHYYIASSHNTYLASDHLTGAASIDRYIDVLDKGCRCVEIQCADGGADSIPIVTHGISFAKSIAFDEVIKVIRDSAFSMNTKGETNDMPVIISLKHKCSWDQQKMLAEILKTELGDMLLRAPLSREPLQAPIYLRGKILLQGRKQEGKTHNELYKLFYFTTTHSPDFEDCDFDCSVVNSCDDAEAEKRMRDSKQRAAWASHNLTNLSRVYSAGSRIRCSNMNPIASWSLGIQMVAMNYQTDGIPMFIHHGKFLENQSCGFVEKPECINSRASFSMPARVISVHIIGGNQLPSLRSDVLSPSVLLNMCGATADNAEFRTKTVNNNGFNPIWDEVFTFTVINPESSHLLFRVVQQGLSRDDFVAFSSIPVLNLLSGFRNVLLYDKNGTRDGDVAYATLSIRIVSAPP